MNSSNGWLMHSRGIIGFLTKPVKEKHRSTHPGSLKAIEKFQLVRQGSLQKCKYVVHEVGPKDSTNYPDPVASQ